MIWIFLTAVLCFLVLHPGFRRFAAVSVGLGLVILLVALASNGAFSSTPKPAVDDITVGEDGEFSRHCGHSPRDRAEMDHWLTSGGQCK